MTEGRAKFVDDWVRPNIVPLIGFLVLVVAQYIQLGHLKEQSEENRSKIEGHVLDRTIHIDPIRDAYARDEIMRRLVNIERGIEELRAR